MRAVILFAVFGLIWFLALTSNFNSAKKPKDLPYVCTPQQREAGECL